MGLKIGVAGLVGAGKTSFCATTGAPTVIISAEAGLLSLRDVDIPVIEVASDCRRAWRIQVPVRVGGRQAFRVGLPLTHLGDCRAGALP